MRKPLIVIGILGALILACVTTFFVGRRVALAQVTAQPFLIQMKETAVSFANKGQAPHTRNFFHAMRRDGSRAFGNFVFAPDGSWKILARRVNLVSEGKVARTEDEIGLVSSYRMTSSDLETLVTASHARTCSLPGFLFTGTGSFLGYDVLKFDRRSADGTSETSESLAPALACHAIWGQHSEKNADGTLKSASTQQAVYIYRGDPPSDIFNINPRYTEVPPSEFVKRGMSSPQNNPATVSPAEQQKLDRLDAAYKQRNRP